MAPALCDATSRSTGKPCQQPERWLVEIDDGDSGAGVVSTRVCQQHGRMLERHGWTFVRELHPVPGYERQVVPHG